MRTSAESRAPGARIQLALLNWKILRSRGGKISFARRRRVADIVSQFIWGTVVLWENLAESPGDFRFAADKCSLCDFSNEVGLENYNFYTESSLNIAGRQVELVEYSQTTWFFLGPF